MSSQKINDPEIEDFGKQASLCSYYTVTKKKTQRPDTPDLRRIRSLPFFLPHFSTFYKIKERNPNNLPIPSLLNSQKDFSPTVLSSPP
jgi:hypothetical protein